MKKVFAILVMAVIALASCGQKTEQVDETTVDSVACDTVAVDSVAIDSTAVIEVVE